MVEVKGSPPFQTPNFKVIMKHSILPVFLATAAGILCTTTSQAVVVSTFSVDMLGNFQPDVLTPTDVAGVIPAAQWLPAFGLTGGTGGVASGGIGGTISVGWNSPQSSIIVGSSSAPGDEDMMEGYIQGIQTADGSIQPAVVQVGTLNLPALMWDYYDVYVYSDQGSAPETGPNLLSIFPSPGSPTNYNHLEFSPGYGAGAPGYLDSQVNPSGNYVVYSGMTAPVFSIVAQPGSSSSSAAINGFQIVGHRTIPEPSTGLALIMGTGLLAMRRRRQHCG